MKWSLWHSRIATLWFIYIYAVQLQTIFRYLCWNSLMNTDFDGQISRQPRTHTKKIENTPKLRDCFESQTSFKSIFYWSTTQTQTITTARTTRAKVTLGMWLWILFRRDLLSFPFQKFILAIYYNCAFVSAANKTECSCKTFIAYTNLAQRMRSECERYDDQCNISPKVRQT